MRLSTMALALAATASSLAIAAPASASASSLAVAAPASATAAAPTQARAAWHTQRHEALPAQKGYFSTDPWRRLPGVRVMQIKARCWGNDSNLKVDMWFLRNWGAGEKIAKSGSGRCNGQYVTVRITNAGHSQYWAAFSLSRKHTVEYWVQYYK